MVILGLFAHVDAGKTTLSEALLYQCHASDHFGRVDHQDAFLDYEEQERKRGITIYTKEAHFTWKEREFTLIDTPGHVDFAAQTERVLPILDAAIFIVSATQGVQAHSETLWQLLKKHHIPTFLFVNKTDITDLSHEQLMQELKTFLDVKCIDFSQEAELHEAIAMCDDELLERYIENESFSTKEITALIHQRRIFPCFFGSALKQSGIDILLDALTAYSEEGKYAQELSAYVYNISYDASGTRLTHVKINGGSIVNKQLLFDEKIDQIRCYHGNDYTCVNSAVAGQVVALCGLKHTKIKDSLHFQSEDSAACISAAFLYRLVPPANVDDAEMMKKLQWLIEEEPTLQLHYDRQLKEIRLQLYGEVQKEVLIERIRQRTGVMVSFEEGSIAYQETIAYPMEGVGHYEMLKHYAEVHLRLIPLKRDSGLKFDSMCPSTMIPSASQRMILHYLQTSSLTGVINGSPLTDMEIVLVSGKVHEKHTSGNDLREATLRALKQGLQMGKSLLLEPTAHFRLSIPASAFARAVYDLEQMQAKWDSPIEIKDQLRISGKAPLSQIHNYSFTLRSYTKGEGNLFLSVIGSQTVNDQAMLDRMAHEYAKEHKHLSSSLFLIQGAPTYIPYDQVIQYADVKLMESIEDDSVKSHSVHRQIKIDDDEWKRVVAKLHQPRKQYRERIVHQAALPQKQRSVSKPKPPCLIVDGYNMIFSWPQLKEMAQSSIESARSALISMLANYHGSQKGELIIVFDAYRTDAIKEHIVKDHSIHIVYTKQAQTADAYIEKTTHAITSDYEVTVATSDREEQNVILAQGAMRMSADELYQKLHIQRQREVERSLYEPQYRNHPLADLRKWNEQNEDE